MDVGCVRPVLGQAIGVVLGRDDGQLGRQADLAGVLKGGVVGEGQLHHADHLLAEG